MVRQVGLSTVGCFPDVAAATDGGWWVTWQIGHEVIVARLSLTGHLTMRRSFDRVSDLAFPRIVRSGAIAYRALDSTLRANGVLMGQAEIGGNHPIAVSDLYIYAQHAPTNGVYRYPWDGSPPDGPVRYGAPTGLSRVTLDGTVRTMDEDRAAVPGMTCPAYTAHVVAGEHPDSGVLVRHDGLGTAHVGVGTLTFTPRVAYAQGHWCVVTHGDPWGVRAFILEDADFSLVQEPPTKPPDDPPKEDPPVQTPQSIIDTIVAAGRLIDARFPELRVENLDAWAAKVAWYLHSQIDPRYGRKSTSPGSRVSPNTFAAKATGGFFAVDIVRDNPRDPVHNPSGPINEWRDRPIDHGLITTQHFVDAVPVDIGEDPPKEPPKEPPKDPPDDGDTSPDAALLVLRRIDAGIQQIAGILSRVYRLD